MKKHLMLAVAAMLTLLATSTYATPILLGKVVPGSPADLDSEVLYVNGLIDAVEGTYTGGTAGVGGTYTKSIDGTDHTFTSFVSASVGTYADVSAGDSTGSKTAGTVSGWQYVLGKYGNISLVWYLGGETFSIPDSIDDLGIQQNLSHYQVFTTTPSNTTTVPDGASTVVLLGMALSGLGFFRRKLQ